MKKYKKPFTKKLFSHNDLNGSLTSLEELKDIPFRFKRIFFIYNTKNDKQRGNHANRNSEFFLICISGSCKIKYYYNNSFNEVILDNPNIGLYLPKLIWKEMYNFSKDSILLVFTNTLYDDKEYIRNFEEYLIEVNR